MTNIIDKYEERIALGNEGVCYILEDLVKEAHTKGTQEALAKVEEWVNGKQFEAISFSTGSEWVVVADDLLHHLQQLKDKKTL